jgi:anti-sigma regulatory factor (Ser/Thr protein kinase)
VDLGRTTFPCTADAPHLARAAVEGWMPDSVAPGVLRDAQLLVSELVANSVQHAGAGDAPIAISAGWRDGTLWFEVADAGREQRVERRRAQPSSGMGLNMVAAAASRWGTSRGDGTKVWFELAPKTG